MNTNYSPKKLLAKKPTAGLIAEGDTLAGHLISVLRMTERIIYNIGEQIIYSTGLKNFEKQLWEAARMAAIYHDIGKANTQFQKMLHLNTITKQAYRHEWLTAYVLTSEKHLQEYFFQNCNQLQKNAVLFSIIGHHLQMKDISNLKARDGSEYEKNFSIYLGHDDFIKIVEIVRKELGLIGILPLEDIILDTAEDELKSLKNYLLETADWWNQTSEMEKIFIAVLKAILISADVAGSAILKTNINQQEWADKVLKRVCNAVDMEKIIRSRLSGNKPRQFQKKVSSSNERVTITKAGCGCGKTLAAYMWAKNNANGRKLFFCYPTTGTATEGFKDYIVPGEMSSETKLLHGRSEFDLEKLRTSGEFDAIDTVIKCESLDSWDVPIVICTVDQVVNIVQNNRKPLFTFPSLANGAFVFDEIHLYDDRLFGGFLRFLNVFSGVPILIMTATMSKGRMGALKLILKNSGDKLKVIGGPKELETIKKYIIRKPVDKPNWNYIKQKYNSGSKILWVMNTINGCMEIAKEAEKMGMHPIVYHSRFKYSDRLNKHLLVIDSFKKEKKGPVLAVTTQVCEVSLDISADILVTELAPVPSIIQRMGRLNRRYPVMEVREVLIINNKSEKPYELSDFIIVKKWMKQMENQNLSQNDLVVCFEKISEKEKVETVESAWLDGGVFSKWAPGRDAGNNASFIMSDDVSLCIDSIGKINNKNVLKYSIPMNLTPEVSREMVEWKMIGYTCAVPEGKIIYDKNRGAQWVKTQQKLQ